MVHGEDEEQRKAAKRRGVSKNARKGGRKDDLRSF